MNGFTYIYMQIEICIISETLCNKWLYLLFVVMLCVYLFVVVFSALGLHTQLFFATRINSMPIYSVIIIH